MRYTFVDQKRAGNVVKENIFVQVEESGAKETAYSAGASPKFDHWIYINAVFDVQIKDQFVDRNQDMSGVYNVYRVSGLPEQFDQACMEIMCEKTAGT